MVITIIIIYSYNNQLPAIKMHDACVVKQTILLFKRCGAMRYRIADECGGKI